MYHVKGFSFYYELIMKITQNSLHTWQHQNNFCHQLQHFQTNFGAHSSKAMSDQAKIYLFYRTTGPLTFDVS